MQNHSHLAVSPIPTRLKNFPLSAALVLLAFVLAAMVLSMSFTTPAILVTVSSAIGIRDWQQNSQDEQPGIQVRAETGRAILFKQGNDRETNGEGAESQMIPHLVLYANEALADEASRTIQLEISGMQVPAGGGNLAVWVETQHGDPDHNSSEAYRIRVFETSIELENNSQKSQVEQDVRIEHTFLAKTTTGEVTPTGYYRVEAVFTPAASADMTEQKFSLDFAFLLENQWVAPLVGLQSQASGEGPSELVIYYMDMISFQTSAYRTEARLARTQVRPFVQNVLVPGMVAAIQQQTLEWGFHWSEAWTSFRGGEDAERISVALTQTGLWYHGQAPAGGYATLTINVKQMDLETYDSLEDWVLTMFSHELFHNQQRSINQEQGGSGVIDGEFEAWEFVTEGTAVVAASVYNPQLGFEPGTADGPYFSRAKKFIAGGQNTGSDLNASFTDISPYEAAIYWRFLYEQFSGLQNGRENPAAGMAVIFKTLETLYADKNLLAIQLEELPTGLAELMDRVFSELDDSPFTDFRSSLLAFHGAVYGLGSDQPDLQSSTTAAGFYDPQDRLPGPEAASILADSSAQVLADWIRGGFGVDYIEIETVGIFQENGFTIQITNTDDGEAVFAVQLLVVKEQASGDGQVSINRLVELGEIQAGQQLTGELSASPDEAGMIAAVVVSRVDGNESTHTSGSYQIVVTPR